MPSLPADHQLRAAGSDNALCYDARRKQGAQQSAAQLLNADCS